MAVRKQIIFTEKLMEMVEVLQDLKGYVSFSSVVHQAVIEMHAKNTPPMYATRKLLTPEEQVKRKKGENEVKKAVVRDERLGIAEELSGIITNEAGIDFCTYYTYVNRTRFEQKLPLTMISPDLVKTQYSPSKEKVESLQKEGKTNY